VPRDGLRKRGAMIPNLSDLAKDATTVVSGYLLRAVGRGAAAVAGAVKTMATDAAGRLYSKVKDVFKSKEESPVIDLERAPSDDDARAQLRHQLKKALENDPALVDAITMLLAEVQREDVADEYRISLSGNNYGQMANVSRMEGGTINFSQGAPGNPAG
jgi:hypothetical protein